MAGHNGRTLASKWAKTEVLLTNEEIASHIPQTLKFNSVNLRSMLDSHQRVVVKPVVGTGGFSIIKVKREESGYSLKHRAKTHHYSTLEGLIGGLKKQMSKRKYLIQKGIKLAKVNGRPIDYRVKYVKVGSRWEIRAIVGRIARPGLFVTNLTQGGTLVTGSQGIKRSLGSSMVKAKKREMRRLTVLATKLLETRYPGISQLGFDYGIDKKGKIWIFEVNTRPH